jgi:hypothetical protein
MADRSMGPAAELSASLLFVDGLRKNDFTKTHAQGI